LILKRLVPSQYCQQKIAWRANHSVSTSCFATPTGRDLDVTATAVLKNKFSQFLRILNNILKENLVRKQSRFKVYNIVAIPWLLYGCEIWTLKQRDIRRLKTAEKKFMRRTAGYNLLDHRRNEDILEEIKVDSV